MDRAALANEIARAVESALAQFPEIDAADVEHVRESTVDAFDVALDSIEESQNG